MVINSKCLIEIITTGGAEINWAQEYVDFVVVEIM